MRIKLTRGKCAVVDRKDHSWLSAWKWRYINSGYAVRWSSEPHGVRHLIFMHKEILNRMFRRTVKKGDHKDTNRLNNRRRNLRPATSQQNQRNKRPRQKNNTTGFKGVVKSKGGWKMYIRTGRHRIQQSFDDPISAAKAYDYYAKKYHGEFARTNFPMRFPREE